MKFYIVAGYLAAFIFTIMLIPQLCKSYVTKDVDDLSVSFILLFLLASSLMIYYSLIAKAFPVLVANFFGLIAGLTLLIAYFIYKDNHKKKSIS